MASLLVLGLAPGDVFAQDWYYDWFYWKGVKHPPKVYQSGKKGPYASEAMCNSARNQDPVKPLVEWDPNYAGSVGFCYRGRGAGGGTAGGASTTAGRGGVPKGGKLELGLTAGDGWRLRDRAGNDDKTSPTLGVDLDVHAGRAKFALHALLSAQMARADTPFVGQTTLVGLETMFGLAGAPRLYKGSSNTIRADLGAAVGLAWVVGCEDCTSDAAFGGAGGAVRLKAGVDVVRAGGTGFSIDVLYDYFDLNQLANTPQANLQVTAGVVMVRLSYVMADFRVE